ncbi:hypothetical protein CNR22_00165 [Sphingobacteriaceae bacterium]|nr:hypothetical protein CNR22_00165 [Sphingobacteriaceae bacterium]
MVSVIIGITLTFFIMIANYNQRTITVYSQSAQLYLNLKSGLQIAQSAFFTAENNGSWMKNQVNEDSLRVRKINWGAYSLISVETKNRHHSLHQSGLYGTYMSADTALMISDNSRPVGMSGNISFKANCYLPAAGTKPAYIEGQSYVSSPQNAAFTKKSPYMIPQVSAEFLKGLQNQMTHLDLRLDSSVGMLPDTYKQSFRQKTLVWENASTHLRNLRLSDNIKLVCKDIEVDSSNHFENILIVCNKVRFKKGFKGKVHVLASDSISMEEACTFEYPSSFVLLPETETTGFNYIEFNKDCFFFGGIVAVSQQSEKASKVFIKFHSAGEVNGFVYCSDFVHLEGKINATVIANKLLLKTPSAVYENHLLSCEMNPKKYADLLAIPLVFNTNSKILCSEYLN